jgi:phage tail sheath gpL-like
MPLDANSYAATVGAAVRNTQFVATAENVPRKIGIIGSFLDGLTSPPAAEVPILVSSPEEVADLTGWGSMLHRLAIGSFRGSQGVETWIIPQAEALTPTQSTGTMTWTGPATEAGTVHLYVGGDYIPVAIEDADTGDDVATKVAAAVTAHNPSAASCVVNGVTTNQNDFTAKSAGPWGDEISLTLNWGFGEELPAGVSVVTVDMAGGAGVPDIQDALDALGTGDDQNEDFFTEISHGYLQHTATLNAVSNYNGAGNDFVGNYSKTVARPFRSLVGDVVAGSAGLTALVSFAGGRQLDRTSGVIAVPGSPNHPAEIAAQTLGVMARINNNRAAEHYNGKVLTEIIPGARADRWTSDYDDRNTAVQTGISPTTIDSNAVTLRDVLTFYDPPSVPITSNGYRAQANISKLQNILFNVKQNFSQEKWQGIIIVNDTSNVANAIDRQKARDVNSVIDDLLALTNSFEDRAWIYSAAFTIERLQADSSLVQVRTGGDGFNITIPIILSGVGVIFDNVIEFDTSLAILLS